MMSGGKGYVLAVADGSEFYIPDAVHIERDDEAFRFADDAEAAKAAEQDGVRLIYGMEHVPDGVYVDTPENREIIQKNLEAYPAYKTAADTPQTGEFDLRL